MNLTYPLKCCARDSLVDLLLTNQSPGRSNSLALQKEIYVARFIHSLCLNDYDCFVHRSIEQKLEKQGRSDQHPSFLIILSTLAVKTFHEDGCPVVNTCIEQKCFQSFFFLLSILRGPSTYFSAKLSIPQYSNTFPLVDG